MLPCSVTVRPWGGSAYQSSSLFHGSHARSAEDYTQALAIARELGDREREGEVLGDSVGAVEGASVGATDGEVEGAAVVGAAQSEGGAGCGRHVRAVGDGDLVPHAQVWRRRARTRLFLVGARAPT